MKIRYMLLHAYGMGGTIRTVVNQANAMAALGHEVEIVSVVRRRDEPQFRLDPAVTLRTLVDQRAGVRTDSLGRRVWRRLRGKIVPLGEYAAAYFTERVEKAAIDYVASVEDGVLVTTRPALNLISARRAGPGVVRVAQEHMNLGSYPETLRAEIARYYGAFDAIAVLTDSDRRDYEAVLPGTRIVRIPNAVHAVNQTPSRQEYPVIVAAGRLVKQKGFDLLLPAFAQVAREHPEWRLRIFGTGPRKAQLRALVGEHGLSAHVTLMGRTNRLDGELARSSVYALSSRFEGLPMVMIEAMTHALPIVAFDCPTGPRDVLTDGEDGLLVPAEDVDALAAALNRLIADRDLRLRMGSAAAATARAYAPENVMPLWDDLFTELLRTRTAPASPGDDRSRRRTGTLGSSPCEHPPQCGSVHRARRRPATRGAGPAVERAGAGVPGRLRRPPHRGRRRRGAAPRLGAGERRQVHAHEDVPRTDEDAAGLPGLYFEHHVKVAVRGDPAPLAGVAVPHGAHVSRNARRHCADGAHERFVTQRCRGVPLSTALRRFEALLSDLGRHGYAVLEAEREFVVHDDNPRADHGWIEEGPPRGDRPRGPPRCSRASSPESSPERPAAGSPSTRATSRRTRSGPTTASPGRRLVFTWRAGDLPPGTVQLDFTFGERRPVPPEVALIPRAGRRGGVRVRSGGRRGRGPA